ncbi:hypothetical protein B4N84_13050 [Flavobacterium sp. IR1]|nr:hypothetical protein B4N84_13050 [Flavobacterium sp. IR1]
MSTIKFLFPVLAFIVLGCEQKKDDKQFEQKVLDEIFVEVVNSTYRDKRLYTCFPDLGKDIYDEFGEWIKKDTTGQHKRDLDCELKREAFKKDTLNLVIAVGNDGLINDSTEVQKYNTKKFIFKHLSELPKDIEFRNWERKYDKFAGAVYLSTIKFNSIKESGILSVDYACGGKCGLSYNVYIKKVNDKWIISKVQHTATW